MATQKYAKVRAGQPIGSESGVCFSISFGSEKASVCTIDGAENGQVERKLNLTCARSSQWSITHFRKLWELMGVRQSRNKVSENDVYF